MTTVFAASRHQGVDTHLDRQRQPLAEPAPEAP